MPVIHPRRVKIGSRYWTLVSAKNSSMDGSDGWAEHDPKTPKKHIWINQVTQGRDLLDTIIHEVTHCFSPHWSEEAVLQFGTELATILWELGYRSEELGDED